MRKGTISWQKRELSTLRRSIVRVIGYIYDSSRPYSFGDRAKTIPVDRVLEVREGLTYVHALYSVQCFRIRLRNTHGRKRHVFTCKVVCRLV